MTTVTSTAWTGRPPWAGSPIEMLKPAVHAWLFPTFDCEWCVGQERHQGCYCVYAGAIAPGVPAGRVARAGRWLADLSVRVAG